MNDTTQSLQETLNHERREVLQQFEDWLEAPMLVLGMSAHQIFARVAAESGGLRLLSGARGL